MAMAVGTLTSPTVSLASLAARTSSIQDFRCAFLEAVGNDDMQPDWGSYLDGGVAADGALYPGSSAGRHEVGHDSA
jgi:hypothetical protein